MKQYGKEAGVLSRLRKLPTLLYYHLKGEPPITDSPITKEFISQLVSRPDPTILEIGCNDGSNTLWFLEVFDSPRIFCFEPDPRAASRFRKRIGERDEIHFYEYAISNKDGEEVFYMSGGQETEEMPEGWDYSGSIRKPNNHMLAHPWCKFEKNIVIPTKKLDTWCTEQGIDTFDFIWMDVQGAEIDVIQGGRTALKNTRFLYTEYSNKELYEGQLPLKQLLKELAGFEVVVRYPDDILLSNKTHRL
ncbi:MAG: FkbM family methyltransferase [Syntrophales bacterium]|jgi:FkbM family methyltransferase|nr:FkbM family methyltransferase [Syntrophales bacterium]